MEYEFVYDNMYGYDVYQFNSEFQTISVHFLHMDGINYRTIVWSEDGEPLIQPHKVEFQRTIYNIIDDYDKGRNLTYESFAE